MFLIKYRITVIFIMIINLLIVSGCGSSTDSDEDTFNSTLFFSGYTWQVKTGDEKMGPGPNYFSNNAKNAWVDSSGYLHLAITNRNGEWQCAEVICTESLGYGTYSFDVDTPADSIDKNTVLGLFTWDDDFPSYYREIDIEISRWGEDRPYPNTQFVIQPYTRAGNIHRFNISSAIDKTINSFTWSNSGIAFDTSKKDLTSIESWNYIKGADYPEPGNEKVHINLWLLENSIPSDGQPKEVVISKFSFVK